MPCKKASSGKLRSLVTALRTATRGRLVETCCARAASGKPTAVPPSNVMNSRRLTARCLPWFPRKDSTPRHGRLLHPSSWAERDDRDHAAKNFFQGGSPKTGHPISPPGPPHRQKSFLTKFPGMAPG